MFVFLRRFLTLLAILATPALHAETAVGLRTGMEAFRDGDYLRAAEGFAEAERKNADDLRIVFNRGAALTASGNLEDAVEPLRKSATARDPSVASKSLSLLGRISVDRARRDLAAVPEETGPAERQEVLDHLSAAETYYSEALSVQPSEADRLSLEQLRAWRSRMTTAWDRADRAAKRSEDIVERLGWFKSLEENVQKTIGEAKGQPDSPKKFQKLYETIGEQGNVIEEIETLQNELQQKLAAAEPDASDGTPHPILQKLDEMKNLAGTVVTSLRNFRADQADQAARETGRRIDQLRINLAPFDVIVQEAEKRQAKLCEENPARPDRKDGPSMEPAEQVQEEQTVSDWMPLMVYRAESELRRRENEPAKNQADVETPNTTGNVLESETSPDGNRKNSLERAVRNGPEIQRLTADAARLLPTEAVEALPKQDRALELLREILEPTRQDPPSQQQQDADSKDSRQPNQGKQQGEDGEQQENDDRQEQQEQGKQEERNRDEQGQERPEPGDGEAREQKEKEKERDSDSKDKEREKAERMLRQVKRRQQEATEKRERIRTLLMQIEPVEKDW